QALVVTVLADTGERYLSKVFNDEWLRENQILDAARVSVAQLLEARNSGAPPLISVPPTATVRQALNLMSTYNVSQLPVLDGGDGVGAGAEPALMARALAGAAQIVEALRGRGHGVTAVDTVTGLLDPADERRLLTTAVGREPPAVAELDERERAMLSNGLASLPAVRDADVLFLCLHAGRGEGGTLQAVLDVIGVPYTGSGALGSALAMDKDLAKRLFRAAGVPVPAWFMAPPPVAPEDVTTALGWPVIVKPSKMGSSVGMSLVRNAEGLDAAV